jgi:hypothetical protein
MQVKNNIYVEVNSVLGSSQCVDGVGGFSCCLHLQGQRAVWVNVQLYIGFSL